MMNLATTVLIRTKNEVNDLPKLVELVGQQSFQPIEIIVVDSGSTDGTVEWVQAQPNILLIAMPPDEFTFGRSLNLGLQHAQGEIVVSISAHAFPCDRHWLQNLVQPFANPQVAGVYGKQVPHADAWPPVRRDYLTHYRDRQRTQTNVLHQHDHWFSNANSAIRLSCWKERPFDESLTGSEDQEWARAMLQLGHTIIYEPTAAVYHSHNEPLPQVYRRTYRETLALKKIYGQSAKSINQWQAAQLWMKAVLGDVRFMLRHQREFSWLVRSPLYRLFWTYGFLKASVED